MRLGGVGLGGNVDAKLDSVFIRFGDTPGNKKGNKILLTDQLQHA